jgi:hypothetical protein
VLGRYPLLTDENVPGPVIEGLRSRGWDVVLTVDVFGQQSVDETLFEYAVQEGRVLVSTDTDCLATASDWLDEGRTFRLIYWHQGRHQHVRVGSFLAAFEALAAKQDAFAGCVEYLQIER